MKRALSVFLVLSVLFCNIVFENSISAYANSVADNAENKSTHYSASKITERVFGYNARTPLGFAYVGTEGHSNNNIAMNYDSYLLPISELGLCTGNVLVCSNDKQPFSSGWLYNIYCFDENMQYLSKASNYAARGLTRSVEITDDISFIGMRVISGGYGNNLPFQKSDIPIAEFQLYKNSVSDENAIDYISLWDEMIYFDDTFELKQEMFGHNVEWDYVQTDNCSGSLQHRLEYYDIYDIDLFKTADGEYIAAHDSAYGFTKLTMAEIKTAYPEIMTFKEVLEYAAENNKKIFVSTTNSEIRAIIEEYGMTDNVFFEMAFNINKPVSTAENNGYSIAQWSCIDSRNFNAEYIKDWQSVYNKISLCTGGYSSVEHFTDEQIDWCVDNDIEVGFAFFGGVVSDYRSNSLSVAAPYHFFKTHNKDVLNKISYFMLDNEEYSEGLIKAAYRYAYGLKPCDDAPEDFKISAVSLSLESSITMNYKVQKSALEGFENLYIAFTMNGKTSNVSAYTQQNDYYVFSFKGVAPQAMKDTVTAVLYGEQNGTVYSSAPFAFSVAEYVYGMLGIYENNEKLRTLLVDLLDYGAAAQVYQNYKTDTLVNADLTDEQGAWASGQTLDLKDVTDGEYACVDNPLVSWNTVGLTLNYSVAIRYKFTAESIEDVKLKILCGNAQWTYTKDDITDNGDGTYTFVFNNLYSNKMQEDVLITAYIDDTAVSNTMRYSVESYACQVKKDLPNTNLEKLTDAMLRYGVSASNYAKSKGV